MLGLAFGTMALVIVLSVFNGLEQLTRDLHTNFNPALRLIAAKGKSFEFDEALKAKILAVKGIRAITSVIEDNGLLRYGDAQKAVRFKGVDDNFMIQYPLEDKILAGSKVLKKGDIRYALVGLGVQSILSISVSAQNFNPLLLWYPKKEKITSSDPLKAFNQEPIMAGGVISIEQTFDNNTIIVPMDYALKLTEYGNKRTSIEIKPENETNIDDLKAELQQNLGESFLVQDRDEQQLIILRAFKIERLFTFIAFSFILAIASFNIFFSLTMLAIEKRKDVAIMKSMGASEWLIGKIFLVEGIIIAFSGSFLGITLGYAICFIQKMFGVVGIGIESSVVSAYPVEMRLTDFLMILFTVILITIAATIFPARKASKIVLIENLTK